VKAWLKRHYREVEEYEEFADFLTVAVERNCIRDMRAHFKHCGYMVN
jgi:hypothetical protein